jgi:hypothetical protein
MLCGRFSGIPRKRAMPTHAKPEGNEVEETDEDKEIFRKMRESEEQLFKAQKENEKTVFAEIRKLVSAYKVRKLREYMDETTYWGLKIVDDHGNVKSQKEEYWFKKAYVSQSCGYTGDDYSGTIWIPLPNGKYLQFMFCC